MTLAAIGCALAVGVSAALTNGYGLTRGTASGETEPVAAYRVAVAADFEPDVFAVTGDDTLQRNFQQSRRWQGWSTRNAMGET